IEGLHVLAGFNGLGVMRSPPLAQALADHLLGRKPRMDLAPFRPDRFDAGTDFPIHEGFTLE
ncbi:MAG: FAD-binding oxidoreductase, partial [Thermoplasmata archaeon]|nr:FAD-binding oxidoreductase [Thermoplasmata archaeon]